MTISCNCEMCRDSIKRGQSLNRLIEDENRSVMERYQKQHSQLKDSDEELFLCRKVRFGGNKNFFRYDPVKFPKDVEIISVNLHAKKRNWFKIITILGKDLKRLDQK